MRALLTVFIFFSFATQAEVKINIGIYQDHETVIKPYADKGLCPSIQDSEFQENQILLEYAILCHAFKLSGLNATFNLAAYPINTRVLNALQVGEIDVSAMGVWLEEIRSAKVNNTVALLRSNEFEKGFYTTPEKNAFIDSLEKAKSSITLLNRNWTLDNAKLKCAGFKIVHVNLYEQMFQMLSKNRGDLIPITFGTKNNLERKVLDISLFPVNGVKMVFSDSTHFAISKLSQHASLIQNHLNRGIARLRELNLITLGYQKVGIINENVKDWQPIQCIN